MRQIADPFPRDWKAWVTPTEVEWSIVKPLLIKYGVKKDMLSVLKEGGEQPECQQLGVLLSGRIFLYRYIAIPGKDPYIPVAGSRVELHPRCSYQVCYGPVRWPELVALYLGNPEWAREMHAFTRSCISIVP